MLGIWQILRSKLQYFYRPRQLPGGQARKKIWFRFRALKWRGIICSFGTTGNNQASTWKLPHFNFKKFRNVPRGAEVAGVFFFPAWFGKWSIVTLERKVNSASMLIRGIESWDTPVFQTNPSIIKIVPFSIRGICEMLNGGREVTSPSNYRWNGR